MNDFRLFQGDPLKKRIASNRLLPLDTSHSTTSLHARGVSVPMIIRHYELPILP